VDAVHSEDTTVYPGSHLGTPGDGALPRNAAMDESGDRKLFAHSSREILLQQLEVVFYIYFLFYILLNFFVCPLA